VPALPPALPVTSRTAATATDDDDNGLAVIAVVNVIGQFSHSSNKKARSLFNRKKEESNFF
jgi:hypothetical protein